MSRDLAEIEWTPKARAVLAAAGDLFYEHGIAAVGVEAVAERAGVTKKTLYDRFGSKERLVVEYLRDRDRRWRLLLDERLEGVADPVERISAVFESTAWWATRQDWKGCSMINAHAEISDPSHPAYAVVEDYKRWLLALLVDLAARAGVDDAERTGRELMLLHEGAQVVSGMGLDVEAFALAREAARRLVTPRDGAATTAGPAASSGS